MNRKIKFRALRLGEWRYGLIDNVFFSKMTLRYFDDKLQLPVTTNVDEKTVGQFTGMLDKNGIEIYEDDIISYTRSVGNWTGQTMTTTHKIIFTEEINAFVMDYGSSYIKLRKHWGYEYEVIGNIFENPDLLQDVL